MQSDTQTKFVVIMKSKEVRFGKPYHEEICTPRGTEFIVTTTSDGWATSDRFDPATIPLDAITFSSRAEAEEWYKKWTPHPWWVRPYKDGCTVLEVKPKYKSVMCGWDAT